MKVKKIVKQFGAEHLNKSAEELVKEVSEKEEYIRLKKSLKDAGYNVSDFPDYEIK